MSHERIIVNPAAHLCEVKMMYHFSQGMGKATLQDSLLKSNHGGRRYLPYVFTEQGFAMLSEEIRVV
ncbi:MAG: hypothetical protein HZB30_10025 [Nitrospirae bacterium]|nr:hypothetical protein [Nitrospirota bacterium]